jgi:monovalent cation/proton antiporter MnhG/PhaG subunit
MLGFLGTALLAVGLILATIGLYGLLRMPDIFDQLHAAGLNTGPAILVMLLAALASGSAEIITSAALVLVFLLVTSPLSGHAIAQAARRRPPSAAAPGHPARRRLEVRVGAHSSAARTESATPDETRAVPGRQRRRAPVNLSRSSGGAQ